MKIDMHIPDNNPHSIMQRIIDGTLAIDSVEEFKEILEVYPNDPLLQRRYADLLAHHQLEEAVSAYARAAQCYLDAGMNLQAIVAKILQWSIHKPSHDQGHAFHALLQNKSGHETPLQRFWAGLSYSQLIAVMRRLVRIRLSAGAKITQAGDPANDIFFIVSGTMAEIPDSTSKESSGMPFEESEPIFIGANDIFGNIFPLNQSTETNVETKAVTDVELVKIAKPVLREICHKHPEIEKLLRQIYNPQKQKENERTWQTVRRAIRYSLPAKVKIFLEHTGQPENQKQYDGIVLDLSLLGASIELDRAITPVDDSGFKGQMIKLQTDLMNDVTTLELSGKIVWQRTQISEKGQNILIGIRFDTLSNIDRELIQKYCSGNIDE